MKHNMSSHRDSGRGRNPAVIVVEWWVIVSSNARVPSINSDAVNIAGLAIIKNMMTCSTQ